MSTELSDSAAQAEFAVPASEKIRTLAALLNESDESRRREALDQLLNWDKGELSAVLADPGTPSDVLESLANHLLAHRDELLEPLLRNPAFTPSAEGIDRTREAEGEDNPGAPEAPMPPSDVAPSPSPSAGESGLKNGAKRETLIERLSRMTPVEKIKTALLGSREERSFLIRDPNKAVARTAIHSPKISEAEVEAYASMKNISEEILRLLGMNRRYMKNYGVVRVLVTNPRAPIEVTLPLIPRLNERDLKSLSRDRNVPDALRVTAAKTLHAREASRNPSLPRRH